MELNGHRDGCTYNPNFDYERLNKQMRRVYNFMCLGGWYTLRDIAKGAGDPEASVSARLRDLRKLKFGGWIVHRRRMANALAAGVTSRRGTFEYRLEGPPSNEEQLDLYAD